MVFGVLKAEERACWMLLHKLVLWAPKATLDSLRPHWEDNFWMIFGLELDGGKVVAAQIAGSLGRRV